MVIQKEIQLIVDAIVKHYQPEKIILFGSHAYGTPHEQSDIDLLIIKDSDLPRYKRAREIRKQLWGLSALPKDILVYTQSEIDDWKNVKQAFITEVISRGKVVYENKKRAN